MTTTVDNTYDRYTISAIGPYAFSFRIFNDTDLAVTAISGSTVVPLTLDTHYTVPLASIDDADGGSITLVSGVETTYAGYTLDIRSNTPVNQVTSIRNSSRFLPEVVEDALDYLNRQNQDADRRASLSPRLPDNEIAPDWATLLSLANRKGKYGWFYNATTGAPELVSGFSTTAITQQNVGAALYPQTAAEIAAGVTPTNYYRKPGDVRRYGAAVDGSTDDIVALRAAISQAAQSNGSPAEIPEGTLIIDGGGAANSGIIALSAGVVIRGAGRDKTIIKVKSGGADRVGSIFSASGVDGWEVRDMTLDGNESGLTQSASHTGLYISGCSNWTIDNVKFQEFGTIPSATEGDGATHILITVYESGATNLVSSTLDVTNTPARGWKITNCHFDDVGMTSTFGVRVYSHFTSATADSAFTIFNSGIIDNCFFNGFKWNPIELAGPGVRYTTISNCESRGSRSYGAFEVDKGASYNRIINCTARDYSVTKTDEAGFRCQGYPTDGTAPNRYAVGNQFIGCTVKNIAGSDTNVPLGFWVSMARQTSIINLDVFDVTSSTPSGAFTCAVRVDDSTNTRVIGGTWRNVNIGVGPGGSATIDGLLVEGVDAETTYRFYTENGTSTRTRFRFVGNQIKVPGVAAFTVSSTSNSEIAIIGNDLFSDGSGSGNTGVSLPSTCVGTVIANTFNDFNIGIDYSGGSAVNTHIGLNKFISCASNISGSNAVRNNMGMNYATDAGGNCRANTFGTAAPGAGTWYVGDIVWNSAPAASGTMGWVCTTGGTPGTWKTFGAIAA